MKETGPHLLELFAMMVFYLLFSLISYVYIPVAGRVEISPFGVVVGVGRSQNFNVSFTSDGFPLGITILFLRQELIVQLETVIRFYYGDEISRKKRRDVKMKLQQQQQQQPRKQLTHSQYGNFVPDIFDETFVREADYVNEDILSPLDNKEGYAINYF